MCKEGRKWRGLHARPNPPPAPVMMTFFPSNRSYGCQRDPRWIQRVRSALREGRGEGRVSDQTLTRTRQAAGNPPIPSSEPTLGGIILYWLASLRWSVKPFSSPPPTSPFLPFLCLAFTQLG